jgi:hypothetical protein
MTTTNHELFNTLFLQKLLLWHPCNHHIFVCWLSQIQNRLVFLYVYQKTRPNDKDMNILDSPLEGLGHHFQIGF